MTQRGSTIEKGVITYGTEIAVVSVGRFANVKHGGLCVRYTVRWRRDVSLWRRVHTQVVDAAASVNSRCAECVTRCEYVYVVVTLCANVRRQ